MTAADVIYKSALPYVAVQDGVSTIMEAQAKAGK